MKRVVFLFIFFSSAFSLTAQVQPAPASGQSDTIVGLADTIPVRDGFYKANTALENAVPFKYPEVNINNIRFYKRVWRDIDLRDTSNYLLAVPGNTLIEAIMNDIGEGKLTPYEPSDDQFTTKLSARQGQARFQDSVLVPIFDEQGNQIDTKIMANEFNPEKVTKFRIKEDIFLDKQRGRVETRIIGVAPLMDINVSDTLSHSVGSTPAFWLYFPQLRYTLVKMDVSDPDRDLFEMTMDDIFVQRKFTSKIVRESSSLGADNTAAENFNADEAERKIQEYKKNLWKNPEGVEAEKEQAKPKEREPRQRRAARETTDTQTDQQNSGDTTPAN